MENGEQNRNGGGCSNHNGGSVRNPKKHEERNKTRQRGLGVEQLERILEEEKNGTVIEYPVITSQPTSLYNKTSASRPQRPFDLPTRVNRNYFSVDGVYGHVAGDLSPSTGHHSMGNALFGAAQPNINAWHGVDIDYPPPFLATEGCGSNLLDAEKVTRSAEYYANPTDGPNHTYSFSTQHEKQWANFNYSTMLNVEAAKSQSAAFTTLTEPPSNQSAYGTYQSVQQDGAEAVHGKRPRPLLLQDSDPSCQRKNYPFAANSLERSKSLGMQYPSANTGTLGPREGLPYSTSLPDLHNRKDTRTDCKNSDGGFPKLGLPKNMSALPSSEPKLALQTNQVHGQGSNSRARSNITGCTQQQMGFSCVAEPNDMQMVVSNRNSNDEEGEGTAQDNIDLNLRL